MSQTSEKGDAWSEALTLACGLRLGRPESKAHAAAFAVITYWSAWLRCHHPLFFFAGLLRHQPMGFYPEHVVVSDAQRVGVKFLPVDLRHCDPSGRRGRRHSVGTEFGTWLWAGAN